MAVIIDGTAGIANNATDLSYTGTLTGGTGVVNLGSGQVYKDASGNVGIGTSSPTNKLDVRDVTGVIKLTSTTGTNEVYSTYKNTGGDFYIGRDNSTGSIFGTTAPYASVFYATGAYPMVFFTNATERARIDSSGNLMVGVVAPSAKLSVSTSGNNYGIFSENTNTATTSNYFYWAYSGTTKFIVYGNGGIANYQANNVNLSDRTEKTDFAPAKSYLETICAIPVQTFKYIDQQDGELNLGVIAQDVQAVAPELVTESNWGTKEDPKMRLSIYQTDLQYALMKSIQELKAIVDAQAISITALNERLTALEAPIV